MKRTVSLLLTLVLLLTLYGCGQKGSALRWQEQYDLGVRYLSEGNYEEAIIAFTAAIEIDPKQADAYIGRGDAYIGSGETEENLAAALADYKAALELDAEPPGIYLKLADIYQRLGDYDSAMTILEQGFAATSDVAIAEKLEELRDPFRNRYDFVSSDKLSQNSLTYITTMIDVMQQEDLIEIHDFVRSEERRIVEIFAETSPRYQSLIEQEGIERIQGPGSCAFVVEDYKAYIHWSTGDGFYSFSAEFHPEQGRGYRLSYTNFLVHNTYDLYFFAGDCVDWNWDGPYWNYIFNQVRPQTWGGGNSSYYEVMVYDGMYRVGTAKDGFKDGVETEREVGGLEMGVDDPLAGEPRIKERIYFDENGKWRSTFRFVGATVTEEVYDNGRSMDTHYWQDYYFIPTGAIVKIEEYESALW